MIATLIPINSDQQIKLSNASTSDIPNWLTSFKPELKVIFTTMPKRNLDLQGSVSVILGILTEAGKKPSAPGATLSARKHNHWRGSLPEFLVGTGRCSETDQH